MEEDEVDYRDLGPSPLQVFLTYDEFKEARNLSCMAFMSIINHHEINPPLGNPILDHPSYMGSSLYLAG
jgi:hypothetical protein